jgi:WD40 repeat protein
VKAEKGWRFTEVALSRDGKRLLAESHRLSGADKQGQLRVGVWDVATGKRLRSWDLDRRARSSSVLVPAVALSPDGSLVAKAAGHGDMDGRPGQGWVWEAATGKQLYALRAHANGLRTVAFSADGRALATGGADGAVCVWEAATGRLRQRFAGHAGNVGALAFSPDGRLLVSGGREPDNTLLVWDLTGPLPQK